MISVEVLVKRLQEDLTRKSHSLAEYMAASSPYVAKGREAMWELLLKVRDEDQEHARRLSSLLVSLGGIPHPGLFHASAADMNYLGIEYLYGLLIRSKRESVTLFEQRLHQAKGYHEAFVLIGDILDAEKRHVAELEECLAAHRPEPQHLAAAESQAARQAVLEGSTHDAGKPKFDLQAYLAAHKGQAKNETGASGDLAPAPEQDTKKASDPE
jgi:hypothetical protein